MIGVACKSCGAVLEDAEELISTLAARERTIRALNAQLADKRDNHKHKDAIEDLARFWNTHCRNGKARAAAKGERFDKTAARLNEGWTVAELTEAILGAAFDPIVWKGQKWNDLKQIMKDASTVEQYIARAPSVDELIARDVLDNGVDESVWVEFEFDRAREWLWEEAELRTVDQLAREIMAGEGRLLEFYRGLHELRLKRDRPQLEIARAAA